MRMLLPAALLWIATLAIFAWSLMATASDGQGALVFAVTLPAMLALLSLSALLTRKRSRQAYRTTLALAAAIGAFFVCAPIPVLNLYSAAWIGAVAKGYEAIYGESPYAAHHHTVDLPGLLYKSLEAQGGDTLDLRGLRLPYEWKKVCIFAPYSDQGAVTKAGLPADWPLATYSKVTLDEGIDALALVGDRYPVYVADLSRAKINFDEKTLPRCVEREKAVFHKKNGLFTLDP